MLDQPEKPCDLATFAGARIREWRKRRGMTLLGLAVACETSQQTISRLETAGMTLSVEWMERISKALGIPPHILLRDDSDASALEQAEARARKAEMGFQMLRTAIETVCRDQLGEG